MPDHGDNRGGSPPLRSDGGKLRLDAVDTRQTGSSPPELPTMEQVSELTRVAERSRPPARFSIIRASLPSANASDAQDLSSRLLTVDGVLGTTVSGDKTDSESVLNVLLDESKNLGSSIEDLSQLAAVEGIAATEFRIRNHSEAGSPRPTDTAADDAANTSEVTLEEPTGDDGGVTGGERDDDSTTGRDPGPGTEPEPGAGREPDAATPDATTPDEPPGVSILDQLVAEIDRRKGEEGKTEIDEQGVASDLATLLLHADDLVSLFEGEREPLDRLASAEKTARSAADRSTVIKATLDGVEQRLDALENTVDDIQGDLDAISEEIDSVQSTVTDQEQFASKLVVQVDSKLENLRGDIETMRSDIDEFEKTSIRELRMEINELREWQASLQTVVSLGSGDTADDDAGDGFDTADDDAGDEFDSGDGDEGDEFDSGDGDEGDGFGSADDDDGDRFGFGSADDDDSEFEFLGDDG